MATHTTRWLVYLRFDVGGGVETYHVAVISKDRTPLVVARAQQRGPSPGARLVEYAVFGSLRNIHPHEVPNFHYLSATEFFERTGGQPQGGGGGRSLAEAAMPRN